MMTHRERFMAALEGRPTDRVPLFPLLMFLAADRAGMSYRDYATNGRALAEAQLLVQERYGLDAITACSDAFRITADLGAEMAYPLDKPPYAKAPLITRETDVERLAHPDPRAQGSRMADRVLALEAMARHAAGWVAVLGWIDMPFAEACSLCGVAEFLLLLKDDPARAHLILSTLTELVIAFALAQMQAGADMIGAGDAAASLISSPMYGQFALPYEQRVCQAIHEAGGLVKLHICGRTTHLLEQMATSGADLYNVDHMVPLARARDVYAGQGLCFKGNLNPVADIMRATPEECRERALACMAMTAGTRYMLSAGCEIPAETPEEVFKAFCEAPRSFAPG
jgi:MtaA/CmuA family methyltransferase